MSIATNTDHLSDLQVGQFHRDGFLNAGMVLSDAEITELSDALAGVIERGPEGFSDGEPGPVLYRDMGAGYESDGRQVSKNPNYQIVNIWECSQPMTPVSAWIPLDTADEENGCMWMVPGSHRWGNQMEFLVSAAGLKTLDEFSSLPPFDPPAGAPIQAVTTRPCPVQRGEVHFHHSLTWHGSPFNQSTRPRQALAIHYMTSEAVFTGRDHPMRQFISLDIGESMIDAGPHFPVACRNGEPIAT